MVIYNNGIPNQNGYIHVGCLSATKNNFRIYNYTDNFVQLSVSLFFRDVIKTKKNIISGLFLKAFAFYVQLFVFE